ncbi:phosphate ABC transporter permease subunit PstA/phosphate ABC transporter phosphate-binding protein [Kitasatospora gansuensis]|uniref:Phosphate transport system permease protein PstA n=1 Tax=Kitasatospora gansuensis TaxID=258050 RepID=A0A7W7SFD9_9ACTN|nr:phosphate ABC transporter permease PstA [Kitasatospora gansuensis]MBB4949367.1 phosphate ABC transporter permease subunit PstA/phosphate ABC transporter phosphate-binding protein [Kitasatospora gansuensis]
MTTTAPPRTTVVTRPAVPAPQRRRRINARRASDHYAFWGSLAGALATSALLFQRLTPFSGGIGFVVCAWLCFLGLYALLVSRDEGKLTVRDRFASAVVHSLAAMLLGVLVWVLCYVFMKGWSALSHSNFFLQDLSDAGPTDPLDQGGALHAVVGTLIQITISLGITIPVGISCAVFLSEVPGRFSRLVRTLVEAMTALPSILAGLFIYAVMVLTLGLPRSGLAAGVALSVMMLPILIRAADVVLRLVPASLKEASYALGAGRWRTVWTVTLPSARSGLATAVILGAARGIGETSPVLLCSGYTKNLNLDPTKDPQTSLPLMAFTLIKFPSELQAARAFGAAALLLGLVLLLFVVARTLGGRGPGELSRRQRENRARQSAADLARMTNPVVPPARKAPVITRTLTLLTAIAVFATSLLFGAAERAEAAAYLRISGAGSTWSYNAVDGWIRNVRQYGMTVDFDPQGSSFGRNQFKNDATDFAVTEIPYGLTDGGQYDAPPPFPSAYLPIVAGGTSFMYNLKINGKRVTDLRLSGETIAKLFTGGITWWDDPLVKADNPGLELPHVEVHPVVRSDGSGTTAQFTTWLSKRQQPIWDDYCRRTPRGAACGMTSFFPLLKGSTWKALGSSITVASSVANEGNNGAITYVEYSYAKEAKFPVAKVLNQAGYYVGPTGQNVAVALVNARINPDLTQMLDDVYDSPAPAAYPLSSYSYMVVHTSETTNFKQDKGAAMSAFGYYFLCEGQKKVGDNGYSPLTPQLVTSGFDQLAKIPGSEKKVFDPAACSNPTFGKDGTNPYVASAPKPPECDKKGATSQCGGTGAKPTGTQSGTGGAAGGTGTGGAAATGGAAGGPGAADGGTAGAGAAGGTGGGAADDPALGGGDGGAAAGGTGQSVSASAIEVASAAGSGLRYSLMVIAGLLLGAVIVLPPVIAGRAARRREGEL